MIPPLLLVGFVIGLCRPYRTVLRALVSLGVLAGCALAWGAAGATGGARNDPFSVALAAINGAVGWAAGAFVAGVLSAMTMAAGRRA